MGVCSRSDFVMSEVFLGVIEVGRDCGRGGRLEY